MKQLSIDALNSHLFEAIEGLKNNNDPNASQNEKMDVETAKAIAGLGKVVIDGMKIKAAVACKFAELEPTLARSISKQITCQDGESI